MFYLCVLINFHKKAFKTANLLILKALISVGMTRFERATTRPPDVYSNRAELHPEIGCENTTIIYYFQVLFYLSRKFMVAYWSDEFGICIPNRFQYHLSFSCNTSMYLYNIGLSKI